MFLNKRKSVINYIFLVLSFLGITGGSLLSTAYNATSEQASADFSSYTQIENNLPNYFVANSLSGNDIKDIFLTSTSSAVNLNIANEQTVSNGQNIPLSNPAYFTQDVAEGEVPTEYYYFDFTTSLSLYKDLSNEQISLGQTGVNLLDGITIDNFTTDGGFAVDKISRIPSKLNLSIKLNKENSALTLADELNTGDGKQETIILSEEGLYTLVIPALVFYTNNGGATFSELSNTTIYYTFMIFDSSTYFQTSGTQAVTFSENLEKSNIISSESYSTYYFYNYSTIDLPTLTYNYKNFKINIHYTDVDDNTFDYFIEYQNGNVVTLDVSGQPITTDISINASLKGEQIQISFIDLGQYDINFEYLYISNSNGVDITYNLPLDENITGDEFKNKSQKVLLYGYQALHSTYDNVNPDTNQPNEKELKSFDFNTNTTPTQSADITGLVNESNATTNLHSSSAQEIETIKGYVETYLDKDNANRKSPISTNQPPVKFVTNGQLNNALDDKYKSKIYSVVHNAEDDSYTLTEKDSFIGFNQNEAGLYLYIIQYQYDQYLQQGIAQGQYYHYQIFFFEVKNTVPSVSVYTAEEGPDGYVKGEEIYTKGFTNKSAFIINNSDANEFDANVSITLTAYDYTTGRNFFTDKNITDLTSVDSNLRYNDEINGILIKNTASYANAKFTITVSSKLADKPSVKTFTIDTTEIQDVEAYNVDESTSNYYTFSTAIAENGMTNRPIAFNWSKKASGANTYAYVKHFAFTDKNCFDTNSNMVIYNYLHQNLLPVSYQLNLDETANWSKYSYTNINSIVSATNVRSENGVYVLQVYDDAGNYTFKTVMIDKTTPVFIKRTVGQSTSHEIFQNGSNLTVPADGTNVYIHWSKFKGLYVGTTLDMSEDAYKGYKYSGINALANVSFKEILDDFFNGKTKHITNAQGTDITGYYILSEISNKIYIKDRATTYNPEINNNYYHKIEFLHEVNGKLEAHEGNCKILIRDESNNYIFENERTTYLNYPSAYVSFNITSDLAQLTVFEKTASENKNFELSPYSQIAELYSYEDANGNTIYTTDEKDEFDKPYTQTPYEKKFSYYTSVNATNPVFVKYIPITSVGVNLDSVDVSYFPYETTCEKKAGNYYYYKTIAENPTITLNLFKFNEKENYTEGEEYSNPLNFGQTDEPLPGKYVITRTYQNTTDSDKLNDAYDFFSRQITFYIDTNGIISPLEKVEDEDKTNSSLESIIGGDILINVHDGKSSDISVSFPKYDKTTGLNSGSFYSKNSFQEDVTNAGTAPISISSNKLPLALYIPAYKYTISSILNEIDLDFDLTINDKLSYYGIRVTNDGGTTYSIEHDGLIVESGLDKQTLLQHIMHYSMTEYELSVNIRFEEENNSGNYTYYASKFDEQTGHYESENDYLAIYELTERNGLYKHKVDYFYKPGTYNVSIYQNGVDPTSDFYSFYNFAFKITSSQPEYELINSDRINNHGYKLDKRLTDDNGYDVYYSNSDIVTIRWQDSNDPYIAKIDKNQIYAGSTKDYWINPSLIHDEGNGVWSITLTNCIEKYKDGLYISMQYEGHDTAYGYKKTLKKIIFDIEAPTETLNTLMNNLENSIKDGLFTVKTQQKQMRVYTNYLGESFDPTDDDNADQTASYITNVNSGALKYYSFTVTNEYFNSLINKLSLSSETGYKLSTVYYKKIDNIKTYQQSTQYTHINNFASLSEQSTLNGFGYYEIIETDWAGNRTIYVVYLINTDDSSDGIKYNSAESSKSLKTEEVATVNNIYAKTDFYLTNLTYNQDPWLYFTFSTNNKGTLSTKHYFKSPFDDGHVYEVSRSNGIISYNPKLLTDITRISTSTQNKHVLRLSNQIEGKEKICYVTVYNSGLIVNKTTQGTAENEAKIEINVPTAEQAASTALGYVYPTEITIERFNTDTKPASWERYAIFNQSSYGTWNADDTYSNASFVTISYLTTAFTNKMFVSAFAEINDKIKFTITDNFDTQSTIIILTGNIAEETISSIGRIYTAQEESGSLTYISSKTITYTYNPAVYNAEIPTEGFVLIYGTDYTHDTEHGIIKLFNSTDTAYYDKYIEIILCDTEDDTPIKNLYLRVYNQLQNVDKYSNDITSANGVIFLDKNRDNIGETNIKADTDTSPMILTVKKDGTTYSGPATTVTTYSRNVTIKFKNGIYNPSSKTEHYAKTITYSTYISRDGGNVWENIDGHVNDQYATYMISGVGKYLMLMTYNDEAILTGEFKLFEITILDSDSSYYYITVDGQQAMKSTVKYSGYEATYVVSLDYADKRARLAIHKNNELGVSIKRVNTIYSGTEHPDDPPVEIPNEIDQDVPRNTIVTEIYTYSCQEAKGDFVIIYIPASNDIVSTITYKESSGQKYSLKDGSNVVIVADKNTEGNFNKLAISFSSYYGVKENAIQPKVYKLIDNKPVLLALKPEVNGELASISLEMSGTYYLQILDSCTPANYQSFNGATYNGYEYVEITFLSSVPFEVITTNAEGEEIVTAPVQKAVYNGEVKLKVTNVTSFSSATPLTMHATRNGEEITITPENNVYTFTAPGYYAVRFSASTGTGDNQEEVREEVYYFTIVNKNESRYAFEFVEFGNYYIEKVLKDGKDVTEELLKYSNFKTTYIDGILKLTSITLNHLDEKTGNGRYEITVKINNPAYASVLGEEFTFALWINLAKPPIKVSIDEGASTTSVIVVSLNVENFYNTVGDCYIKIGSMKRDYTAENISTYPETDTITLSGSGTYYIQVYTQSGHLIYSYKVTKTEPLNTFAILAIVLGVIALSAIVFITIKLRKRQKVK